MMTNASLFHSRNSYKEDNVTLRQQLVHEIHRLERQLERIKLHSDHFDVTTLATYEEMIDRRKDLLNTMS